MNAAIANTLMPSPSGKKLYSTKQFITGDIVWRVNECYKLFNNQVSQLAKQLEGSTTKETCYNVWQFIKDNIRYRVDTKGDQWVQTPAALWQSKVGDCKSFSVFAASCLHALGIDGVIRFASYDPANKTPKHVYVVANDGPDKIVIDATPYEGKVYWNTEFDPRYIYDYSMSTLAIISGIPAKQRKIVMRRNIGGMYSIGKTINCDNGDVLRNTCDSGSGGPATDAPDLPTKGSDVYTEPADNTTKAKFPWLLVALAVGTVYKMSR